MIRRFRSLLQFVCFLIAALPACFAQGDRGLITGVVRDTSGAVLPAATVRAVHAATNTTTTAETNAQGIYTIGLLQPGLYRVIVERTGFKRVEREGIEVRVNDRITLDVVLQVGEVTESVKVEARASLLETASSSMGVVIDNRRIRDLPLVHGNPLMLQFLAPGITFNGNPSFTRPFDGAAAVSSVNGAKQGGMSFALDGVVNQGETKGPAYQPSVEFIQEYKVETAGYDASQGNASAGWVNISLKSGTNDFHGSAYLYLQNRALNANSFFNNLAGQPKAPYAFNRPGATIGGPIFKNRTFFFFGYERIKHNLPSPGVYTVPTPAEKGGDFSQLLALGPAYQIYDPLSTTPAGNGRYQRLPFAGNVIPSSRINPIGKAVAGFYPDPNQPGSADGGENFSFGGGIEPDRFYSISTRVDHNISTLQRLFGRVVLTRRRDGPYRNYFPNVSGNNYISKNRGAAFDYVYTLNPKTVLNLRYGYTRYYVTHDPETKGFDLTSLGFPAAFADAINPANHILPYFNISGFQGFLSEQIDGRFYDIHSFDGSVSRAQGKHFLRMGAEYRSYRFNTFNRGWGSGQFTFGQAYVNGPLDNSPLAPRGQGLAALLLGIPSGGLIDNNDSFAGRNSWSSVFIQDDWKVSPKLTVNVGLRYEYESAPVERFNRSVAGFDFNAASPVAAAAQAAYAANPIPELPPSQFRVNGGLTFPGASEASRQIWSAPNKNFMPRFGFAYSLTSNTVLRGGYGIFYDFIGVTSGWSPIQTGFNQQTALVPSLDNGVTYQATLSNPFPGGIARASGSAQGLATFLGKNVSFFFQNPRSPYNQKWSFGVQHQFAANWLLDLSYVGSRGTALTTSRELNGIPTQYLSRLPVRDQATIDRLSRQVPNPFANLLPGTTLNSTTISASQLLRAYPQFTSVTTVTNEGYNWYHGLQTYMEKRFSAGYTFMASWTWSKNMEATTFLNQADPRPERVISDFDRTHRFVLNGIYELPFGKGRRFAAGVRGPMGKIIEGWQINGVYQLQSGQPLGIGPTGALGNFIYYGDPTRIVLSRSERTREHWFNTAGFETDPRRQPDSNLRLQSSRFSGLRAAPLNFLDCSALKRTSITERLSVDFRAEFINALNHTVFNPPDTNPTSRNFGVVTSAVAVPRTIQFGIIARF